MSKKLAPLKTTEEKLGHQPDVVNVPRIVVLGVALTLVVAVAMAGMVVLQRSFGPEPAEALPDWAALPADGAVVGPEVSPNQSEDLRKLRAAHEATLTSYAWLDEQQGIARVPIDRAMNLLLESPLPARGASDE